MLIRHVQTRIANTLCNYFRKSLALALLGAHVQLLTLVDIEEKGGGLGPVHFLIAALGSIEQIAQRDLAIL